MRRHAVLACLTPLLALSLVAAGPAEIGRVKLAAGAASVKRAGATLPIRPGFVLLKGDTLVTGPNGRIGVTFSDNTRFATGPNSRVQLTDYAFNSTTHDGQFLTKIDRGSLAIVSGQIAKKKHDAMKVRTPTSLLGVRGTRFVVTVG